MPKINLGLSREDRELMKKKLENLKDPKPGVSYNSYSPRAQRDKKYVEPSESSEEEEEDNKKKSKFFKHTEKERDNERKKRRDERKKVKDDDFDPDEDSSDRKRKHEDDDDENNWLKRRRKHERSPPPDLDNFVPKTTSRKIERKPVARTQKIDPETLMESSNYQKFNRTLESIFDNSEEVKYSQYISKLSFIYRQNHIHKILLDRVTAINCDFQDLTINLKLLRYFLFFILALKQVEII